MKKINLNEGTLSYCFKIIKNEPKVRDLLIEIASRKTKINLGREAIKDVKPGDITPLFSSSYQKKVVKRNGHHDINEIFQLFIKYLQNKFTEEKFKTESLSSSVWTVKKK